MPLLGFFGILFWAGIAMWIAGFIVVYRLLAKHGGLDRGRTLDVVFGEDSPMKRPEAGHDRMFFRIGVFVMGFGLMTLFSGISVGEERELRVCVMACRHRGFMTGRFAPSEVDRDASGKPLRGCFCVSPTGSAELRRDETTPLRPPPPP